MTKAVFEDYEFTDDTASEDKLQQRKHMPQSPILPGKGCMKVIDPYNQQFLRMPAMQVLIY